jgi:hypothetical protein
MNSPTSELKGAAGEKATAKKGHSLPSTFLVKVDAVIRLFGEKFASSLTSPHWSGVVRQSKFNPREFLSMQLTETYAYTHYLTPGANEKKEIGEQNQQRAEGHKLVIAFSPLGSLNDHADLGVRGIRDSVLRLVAVAAN